MGAMLLASALNRGISPGISGLFSIFPGGDFLCLGHWLGTWPRAQYYMRSDEHLTLFPIYLSLFVVSTLWLRANVFTLKDED